MLRDMNRQLDDEYYGVQKEKTFPLYDEKDVRNAGKNFKHCATVHKRALAKNIEKRVRELGIKLEADNIDILRNYISKSYITGDNKMNEASVSLKDVYRHKEEFLKLENEDWDDRYFPMIKDFAETYSEWRKDYDYIHGIVGSSALLFFNLTIDIFYMIAYRPFTMHEHHLVHLIENFFGALNYFKESEQVIDVKTMVELPLVKGIDAKIENRQVSKFTNVSVDSFDIFIEKNWINLPRTTEFVIQNTNYLQDSIVDKEFHLPPISTLDTLKCDNALKEEIYNKIDSIKNLYTSDDKNNLFYKKLEKIKPLDERHELMFSRIMHNFPLCFTANINGLKRIFIITCDFLMMVGQENPEDNYIKYASISTMDSTPKITKITPIVNKDYDPLTEGLSIDEDGTVKVELTAKTNLMDEYSSNHKKIVEAVKNDNMEEVKLLLAYDFALLDRIEHQLNNGKIKEAKKQELIKAKQFLTNDFKSYLKVVTKKEPRFNFTKYYDSCEEIKKYFVLDKKTINGVKALLRNILL